MWLKVVTNEKGEAVHSKKFLYGKIFICTLHRGHLQVSIAILLICILWSRIRVISDWNMKLPICTVADCVISARGGGGRGIECL